MVNDRDERLLWVLSRFECTCIGHAYSPSHSSPHSRKWPHKTISPLSSELFGQSLSAQFSFRARYACILLRVIYQWPNAKVVAQKYWYTLTWPLNDCGYWDSKGDSRCRSWHGMGKALTLLRSMEKSATRQVERIPTRARGLNFPALFLWYRWSLFRSTQFGAGWGN